MRENLQIPQKIARVVNFILLAFLLIFGRTWYLATLKREHHMALATKPRLRHQLVPVARATIRDRFNLPLAINKPVYQVAILYDVIRSIPRTAWEMRDGKKVKVLRRSEYIKNISQMLAKELGLFAQDIEDIIHAKASLFPNTPFFLKEGISEEQYYKLHLLERKWPGLVCQIGARRYYPFEKAGCDILGYMGRINQKEYLSIAHELKILRTYVQEKEEGNYPFLPEGYNSPMEVRNRLHELKERSYTINDLVGKGGVEAQLDEDLRGFCGLEASEVDVSGNILRSLPYSRTPLSGKRAYLSLSIELQEFAESLLALHEATPYLHSDDPYIRGGAIVAMIPTTGEIVAMATSPRFNPNDFITDNQREIRRALETEGHIAEIWKGETALEKEIFSFDKGSFITEKKFLTWDLFLEMTLEKGSPLLQAMKKVHTIGDSFALQKTYEETGALPDSFTMLISHPQDQLLLINLNRLLVDTETFSDSLLEKVKNVPLFTFFSHMQLFNRFMDQLEKEEKVRFHQKQFHDWREQQFTAFLKEKRAEEKAAKRYAKPYTDYLKKKEEELFALYWEEGKWDLCQNHFPENGELREAVSTFGFPYLQTLRLYADLNRPLVGKFSTVRRKGSQQLESHLAQSFYPKTNFGYGRSFAYRQSTPQGSIFKLAIAEAALLSSQGNPLTLYDEMHGQTLGYTTDGKTISRNYKGGTLPRRSPRPIGKIDIRGAIEMSSNIYFSLLAAEKAGHPETLIENLEKLGFGHSTGIDLPGEVSGILPTDLAENKTGLYSFAIGQHTLTVTPLQTATFLCNLANHGKILKPQIVKMLVGKEQGSAPFTQNPYQTFPFSTPLSLVGIEFPLFTETQSNPAKAHLTAFTKDVKENLPLTPRNEALILEGMARATSGERGTARPFGMRNTYNSSLLLKDYRSLHQYLAGKTGTAEIMHKGTIDLSSPAKLKKHIWFGAIAYPEAVLEKDKNSLIPELVVIVYLQHARGGRDGAPLAAQVVKRWRALKAKYHQP